MSGQEKILNLQGFKGLRSSIHASLIEDNQFAELLNFDIGRGGELTKRPGFTKLAANSLSVWIDLLGYFKTSTFFYFIGNSNAGMYRSVDGITWTNFAADGTHSGADCIQYADKIYMPRQANTIGKYDGTTFSQIVGSPAGIQGVIFKDRLFVYSPWSSFPSRLYYSAPGDPDTWPGTNFIDVNTGDGDAITAIVAYQDRLLIFKGKSVWTLYVQGSPSNWVLRQQHSEIGCVSYRTIKEIEGALYFLSLKGVYQTDGITFNLISNDIEDAFSGRQLHIEDTAGRTIEKDYAFRLGDRYVLILNPEDGTPTYYVYYFKLSAWSKWSFSRRLRYPVEIPFDVPGVGVYLSERTAPLVFRLSESNTHQDESSNFEVRFVTKELSMEAPSLLKRGKWAAAELLGDSDSNVDINYILDGQEIDSADLELDSVNYLYKIPGPGMFRTLQFKLSEITDSDLTVLKLMLVLHLKRHLSISGAP